MTGEPDLDRITRERDTCVEVLRKLGDGDIKALAQVSELIQADVDAIIARLRFQPTEEERQMILLAIAHTSVLRPGWDDALRTIALKLDGHALYEGFKKMAPAPHPEPLGKM